MKCPSCGTFNKPGAKVCGCNFVLTDASPFRCAWRNGKKRCGMMGSISEQGMWYCSWHYRFLNRSDIRFASDREECRLWWERFSLKMESPPQFDEVWRAITSNGATVVPTPEKADD